jgi:hypothetical protein
VQVRKTKQELRNEGIDQRQWYMDAISWCEKHGKKRGFAWHAFKEKFGEEPKKWRGEEVHGDAIDPRVAAYLKSKLIKFAKSRPKEWLRPETVR